MREIIEPPRYEVKIDEYHEPGCDSPIVNPITEWAGGSNVIIVGYECPKCHKKTFR